jgi:hypothetical protein
MIVFLIAKPWFLCQLFSHLVVINKPKKNQHVGTGTMLIAPCVGEKGSEGELERYAETTSIILQLVYKMDRS